MTSFSLTTTSPRPLLLLDSFGPFRKSGLSWSDKYSGDIVNDPDMQGKHTAASPGPRRLPGMAGMTSFLQKVRFLMRSQYLLWFGIGIMGTTLLTGCRNSCSCCSCDGIVHARGIVMAPSAPVEQAQHAQQLTPVTHILPPAKKENVQMTTVAPGASLHGGGTPGTIELTAREAEAMGVKPGYTPGALYVPASHSVPVVQAAEPKVIEPPVVEEGRTAPSVSVQVMVDEKRSEPVAPSAPVVEDKQEPVMEVPTVIEKRSDPDQ